ncbi:YbaY family lipoprotein [Ovoidimarina sediminis]|uniref:YbaY family lipoprotein n=1 Tax=Ovoidimarina sediminis TaxID=3079856 RepID=UPI002914888B|nr:YbaY family lipoprotein [Rhodophyticola sp. MJ-SS7]MDU8944272.1 YbaY family lipoprotein [Rhodophyticola sp. MJ-SS7]
MLAVTRAVVAIFVSVFLASGSIAETRTVDVTVSYRERIALPPKAEVQVEIQDVSRADSPAEVLNFQRVAISRVPMTLRLVVDEDQIDERHSYTVRGSIYSGDQVLFRSTTATPVLTRGAPDDVDLLLVSATPSSAATAPANPIAGVQWAAFELGGRMLILEDPPTIVFDTDGSFALYAGCNRFAGSASIGDRTIAFPETMAGTRMACPDDRAKLEQDVLDALSSATAFVRNDALLSMTNSNGVTVVRFNDRPR